MKVDTRTGSHNSNKEEDKEKLHLANECVSDNGQEADECVSCSGVVWKKAFIGAGALVTYQAVESFLLVLRAELMGRICNSFLH
ncbi:hypothetical protein QL285_064058 [Trifolium repens]|nr:hypothetical protein QL285_064058 [Trifolium repens]